MIGVNNSLTEIHCLGRKNQTEDFSFPKYA